MLNPNIIINRTKANSVGPRSDTANSNSNALANITRRLTG